MLGALACAIASASACLLVTNLDGLSSGGAPANDGAPADGSVDGADGDAARDALGTFCSDHPSALACMDFEDGKATVVYPGGARVPATLAQDAGALTFVAPGNASAFALRTDLVGDNSPIAAAVLVTALQSATRVRVEIDLRPETSRTDSAYVYLTALPGPGVVTNDMIVAITQKPGGGGSLTVNGNTADFLFPSTKQWTHVALELAGPPSIARVYLEGKLVATAADPDRDLTKASNMSVLVGLAAIRDAGGGPATSIVDNVLVTIP